MGASQPWLLLRLLFWPLEAWGIDGEAIFIDMGSEGAEEAQNGNHIDDLNNHPGCMASWLQLVLRV